MIVDICARAASSDAPAPAARIGAGSVPCRLDARSPNASGVHICTPVAQNIGKSKPRGITPTTVYDVPSTSSCWPRTSRLPGEPSLPVAPREHHGPVSTRRVVFRPEQPTEQRANAGHRESTSEVTLKPLHALRRVAAHVAAPVLAPRQ